MRRRASIRPGVAGQLDEGLLNEVLRRRPVVDEQPCQRDSAGASSRNSATTRASTGATPPAPRSSRRTPHPASITPTDETNLGQYTVRTTGSRRHGRRHPNRAVGASVQVSAVPVEAGAWQHHHSVAFSKGSTPDVRPERSPVSIRIHLGAAQSQHVAAAGAVGPSRWPPWPPSRPPRRRPGIHAAGTPRRIAPRASSATSSRRPPARWTARAKLVFAQHAGLVHLRPRRLRRWRDRRREHLRRAPAHWRLRRRQRRAAGPHYNQSTVEGVVPLVVSDQTEVWLDVTVGQTAAGSPSPRCRSCRRPATRSFSTPRHTDDHGTGHVSPACR